MLIRDKFLVSNWTYSIRASDISSPILERAKKGLYTQMEVNRGLPAPLLVKHFAKNVPMGTEGCSERDGQLRADEPVSTVADVPPADIVFLRNVLIYFEVDVRKRILAQVRKVLRSDGLFLGGAEER